MSFIPLVTAHKPKPTDSPKFGQVVANNDPLMLGRIKVRIQGIFEGDAESLPWVRRKTDTLFCGNDCEVFDVPEVGSIVEVRWSYDDNTPIYSGAPYNKKHQTNAFTDNYPFEGGFKFGPHTIKFDKASKLMTIGNSKVQIQLDALGGCSIACNDLHIQSKRNVTINADNVCIGGDLTVDGQITATKGESGVINAMSMAVVSGGIVQSIKGAS